MSKIKCEHCDEMRVSRCYSAECPVELQIAANSYVSLAAENERLKALVAEMVEALERAPQMRHFEILAEAMSEVKATNDGQSGNSITEIVDWCIEEINALPPRGSALVARAKGAI